MALKYVAVQSGGLRTDGEFYACAVDPNGTILKEEWLDNGDTFELPEPLVHSGLVFDGWTGSQQITETVSGGRTKYSVVINDNNFLCAPLYHTESGLNEFKIKVDEASGLTVNFYLNGSNITVDWGDGNTETIASSSGYQTHTYSDYGEYVIKTNAVVFINIFQNAPFILQEVRTSADTLNISFSENKALQTVYFSKTYGENATETHFPKFYNCNAIKVIAPPFHAHFHTLQSQGAEYCYQTRYLVIPYGVTTIKSDYNTQAELCYFVIPNSVTTIESSAFSTKYLTDGKIKVFVIPSSITSLGNAFRTLETQKLKFQDGITSIPNQVFYNNRLPRYVEFPNTLVSIGNQNFSSTKNEELTLPNTLTTLGNSCFSILYSHKATIPSGVTSIPQGCFQDARTTYFIFEGDITEIQANAFNYCSYAASIDLTNCTAVPTLSSSSAFTGFYGKILVPTALYNDWIVATNWSSLASKIVAA